MVIIRLEIVFSFLVNALSTSSGADYVGRLVRMAAGRGRFSKRGSQNSLKDTQWREANKRQDVGE